MAKQTKDTTGGSTDKNGGLARTGTIGIVVAGAAARGPYEAGVLAELMPRLFSDGKLDRAIVLGTSSGGVNAALWSYFADGTTPLSTVGDRVCDFWLKFDQPNVFRLNLVRTLTRIGRLSSLTDTTPLYENSLRELGLADLTSPISKGKIGTVGVVATTCATGASGGRSCVFFSGNGQAPAADDGAIDYVPTPITLEHVLASAAIPAVFPPALINVPAPQRGYYMDGGVRLNAPIEPLLKLGAERVVVVSSHATRYPTSAQTAQELPDVVDIGSQALHSLLADGTIEDLRRLRSINKLVAENKGKPLLSLQNKAYREVELIEASPQPGELAALATGILKQPGKGLRELRIRALYRILRSALAGVGTGTGNDELLSYMLFEQSYARAQIALGRSEGIRAAKAGWKP